MENSEAIEKVRQAIMRFRELLTLMRSTLDDGEHAYEALFARFSPEELAALKEKDRQWKLAETLVTDTAPLQRTVMRLRFEAHNLERDFEQLYDILAANSDTEGLAGG